MELTNLHAGTAHAVETMSHSRPVAAANEQNQVARFEANATEGGSPQGKVEGKGDVVDILA